MPLPLLTQLNLNGFRFSLITNSGAIHPPSAWMQYGTSPTEIILAIAIVIGSLAGMIGVIALLVQVLVPVMRSDSSQPKQ